MAQCLKQPSQPLSYLRAWQRVVKAISHFNRVVITDGYKEIENVGNSFSAEISLVTHQIMTKHKTYA